MVVAKHELKRPYVPGGFVEPKDGEGVAEDVRGTRAYDLSSVSHACDNALD